MTEKKLESVSENIGSIMQADFGSLSLRKKLVYVGVDIFFEWLGPALWYMLMGTILSFSITKLFGIKVVFGSNNIAEYIFLFSLFISTACLLPLLLPSWRSRLLRSGSWLYYRPEYALIGGATSLIGLLFTESYSKYFNIVSSSPSLQHSLIIAIIAAFCLLFYFIPTFVAYNRSHQSKLAIFFMNLTLGWSVIGWIVALIWSGSGLRFARNNA